MSRCAFLSFRFGLTDGVSVAARAWMGAFRDFGFDVTTVAGEGDVTHLIPGLAIDAAEVAPESLDEQVAAAVADAELVVVENLATLPLNLAAARSVGRVLAGRPTILHHHDPPWHRAAFEHITELPLRDPAWRHVTINRITAAEMAERGIETTVIYNGVDAAGAGDREVTRQQLGVARDEPLLVHPVRAIRRKNVPTAIELAESVGGTYWLTGPAEEGYGDELAELIAGARCRVIHRPIERQADLYAACDAVLYPSTWEGFGIPPIEASLRRRGCVVGSYPFAEELRERGFQFLAGDRLGEGLAHPDIDALEANAALAERHFSVGRMRSALRHLLDQAGWLP